MRPLAVLSALLLLAGCSAEAPVATPEPGPPTVVSSAVPTVVAITSGGWPPDAVPWRDDALTVADLPGPGRESPRPAARPCTAADLPTVEFVGHNGAAGTRQSFIEIRNAGPSRCSIGGYPVLFSGGKTVPVNTDPGTLTVPGYEERPATVDPGERARFVLGSSYSCGGGVDGRTYSDISVRLLDREYAIPELSLYGSCPIGITGIHRLLRDLSAEPHYSGVRVRIEAPAKAKPGTDLDYTVTLTNTGGRPLALEPCLTYMEMLYKGVEVHRLNCAPGTIPAGGSLRFAMRLHIPDYTPAQSWQLEWSVREPGAIGPTASAQVLVE
ncbi:DUF4232 domain-containing protein [Catellatospora tritici]|uniref:DUF4232 domain-containing protein n=1 Tax=Catellatospora tritici TaxID=2851566 RepID=UPI001C2CDBA6|nr:DUF4232 domain-containing protein [Catellatospora tritici]MBV1851790.1 DUF4232 domain-containing protein [Catellatospora tritici]